jgi:hypothetical protein
MTVSLLSLHGRDTTAIYLLTHFLSFSFTFWWFSLFSGLAYATCFLYRKYIPKDRTGSSSQMQPTIRDISAWKTNDFVAFQFTMGATSLWSFYRIFSDPPHKDFLNLGHLSKVIIFNRYLSFYKVLSYAKIIT